MLKQGIMVPKHRRVFGISFLNLQRYRDARYINDAFVEVLYFTVYPQSRRVMYRD